jgi:hypothetical protein
VRSTILAALAAALLAAVGAHVGIDIAGDYLLRDDTYDHVAHGSRELFTLFALLCACGAFTLLLRDLVSIAASLPRRVRLLRFSHRYFAGWTAAVAALALCLVPAMETIDTLRSGGDVDSLADAFGGSLLLGGGITLACALAVCALLFVLVGWLCRYRHDVARLVGELLSITYAPPQREYAQRSRTSILTRAREMRAQRRSKRGPPAPLRLRSVLSR